MKIVRIKADHLPADFGDQLRALATRVDRNEITTLVMCYQDEEQTHFHWPSSKWDSVVLASILQQQALDKIRKE